MFRAHWFIGGCLALATATLFAPTLVFAQWSPSSKHTYHRSGYNPSYYAGTTFRIPPGAKGYQTTRMIQQHHVIAERAAAAASTVRRYTVVAAEPAATSLAVDIDPPPGKPMTVDIRGPDGQVRRFPVASPDAIRPRTIIVHPGEKLSITLNGSIRVQIQKK